MTTGDWLALGGTAVTVLGIVWAIIAWSFDRYERVKTQLQEREASSIKDAIGALARVVEKLEARVDRWEQIQNNQATASMQQFHALELAIREYAADIHALNQTSETQFKHLAGEMERVWRTMAPASFTTMKKGTIMAPKKERERDVEHE